LVSADIFSAVTKTSSNEFCLQDFSDSVAMEVNKNKHRLKAKCQTLTLSPTTQELRNRKDYFMTPTSHVGKYVVGKN
jgi:hypothetical protein